MRKEALESGLVDRELCLACARGHPEAIRAFEREYFSEVPGLLRRAGIDLEPDEAVQLLRERLFLGIRGGTPKIGEYRGTGSLRRWFRITAQRTFLNHRPRVRPTLAVDDPFVMNVLLAPGDPETDYMRNVYQKEFRDAFAHAYSRLLPKNQVLLRCTFADGMTVDEVGAVFSVHRATAARWVVKAHAELLELFRDTVKDRLRLRPEEYESLVRLVRSRLDLGFASSVRAMEDQGTEKTSTRQCASANPSWVARTTAIQPSAVR